MCGGGTGRFALTSIKYRWKLWLCAWVCVPLALQSCRGSGRPSARTGPLRDLAMGDRFPIAGSGAEMVPAPDYHFLFEFDGDRLRFCSLFPWSPWFKYGDDKHRRQGNDLQDDPNPKLKIIHGKGRILQCIQAFSRC